KQLATLRYEIDTGVDLAAAMGSEPDRGALRDFMREFELRAVMERLEEALPEGEAVPGRSVEKELAVEAEEGTPGDLEAGVAALGDVQRARLEQLELVPLLREVELPLVHVLAAMEREGLKLDAGRLAEVGGGFGERIATLEKEIFALAEEEFTIGSPQQVGR